MRYSSILIHRFILNRLIFRARELLGMITFKGVFLNRKIYILISLNLYYSWLKRKLLVIWIRLYSFFSRIDSEVEHSDSVEGELSWFLSLTKYILVKLMGIGRFVAYIFARIRSMLRLLHRGRTFNYRDYENVVFFNMRRRLLVPCIKHEITRRKNFKLIPDIRMFVGVETIIIDTKWISNRENLIRSAQEIFFRNYQNLIWFSYPGLILISPNEKSISFINGNSLNRRLNIYSINDRRLHWLLPLWLVGNTISGIIFFLILIIINYV